MRVFVVLFFAVAVGVGFFLYFFGGFDLLWSNDSQRKKDIAIMQAAIEQYHKDNGSYPLSTAKDSQKPYRVRGFKVDHSVIDWGEEWVPYIMIMPKDPDSKKSYVYFASPNGQAYWLYASLEDSKDKETCSKGTACISISGNGIAPLSCGGVCNYGVSSRNVSP